MLLKWEQDSETDVDTAKMKVERARAVAYELCDIIGERAVKDGVTNGQRLGYANYGESLRVCVFRGLTDALQNRLWGTRIKLERRLRRIIQSCRLLRRSMILRICLIGGTRLRLRESKATLVKRERRTRALSWRCNCFVLYSYRCAKSSKYIR
jgi:hypothetical protein